VTELVAIARVTARGLLSRRRFVLMLLLAGAPVLVALLVVIDGRTVDSSGRAGQVMDLLVVRTVLPLLALVFGTAALGGELDDGTAIYTLVKPVPRWRIVAAKLAVAGGLTAALAVGSVVVSGLLIAGAAGTGGDLIVRFTAATLVASFSYAAVFLALGVLTSRALVVGLVYTLIWEGGLAGLFEGIQALSIRQYSLGIAGVGSLDPVAGFVLSVAVLVGAFGLASYRLGRYEVRAAD
jgi:ABC-2 type transport system permease protein